MAKFNYQDYLQSEKGGTNARNQVGFFGLKNNGDEAIVRFAFDSLDDLEFVAVHNVSVNGKYRKANCIRELNESVDKCPLCKAGIPLQQRVFVPLIQYDLDNRDNNGRPSYSAKVWERSVSFAKKLQTHINNYGNLSEHVFKITRIGAAGDMKTTYDVSICMPQIYNPELYVKDFSAFDNYTVIGTIVIDEDEDGLQQILNGTWTPGNSKQTEPLPKTQVVNTDNMSTQVQINGYPSYTTNESVVLNRPKRTYTY